MLTIEESLLLQSHGSIEIVCINSLKKYKSYINPKSGFSTVFLSISTDPTCLELLQSLTWSW